jgi:DNA (cytosine-5)-methyltransferase 1
VRHLRLVPDEQAEPYRVPSMAEVAAVRWNGLTCVSTFSGCGGSSLGFRMAGFRVPVACEFVPAAADTYQANAPGAVVLREDIRQVEGARIRGIVDLLGGEVDVLEGSPPCAGASGTGGGASWGGKTVRYSDTVQRIDDLFDEFVRLVMEVRPRAFVAENVPGMLTRSAGDEDAPGRVTRAFASLGYRVASGVLDASHFGVPQSRRRLFFVGIRRDVGVEPSLPRPGRFPERTLREALAWAGPQGPEVLEAVSMLPYATGRTWEAMQGRRPWHLCLRCEEPLTGHGRQLEAVPESSLARRRRADREGAVEGLFDAAALPGAERSAPVCADGSAALEVKRYRLLVPMDPERPCFTVVASSQRPSDAGICHPFECRKFTPDELKAISSFPRDFALTGSVLQQSERVGRAVPPFLSRAVAEHVAELLT